MAGVHRHTGFFFFHPRSVELAATHAHTSTHVLGSNPSPHTYPCTPMEKHSEKLVANGSALLIRQNGALQSHDTRRLKKTKKKTTSTNKAPFKMAGGLVRRDAQPAWRVAHPAVTRGVGLALV